MPVKREKSSAAAIVLAPAAADVSEHAPEDQSTGHLLERAGELVGEHDHTELVVGEEGDLGGEAVDAAGVLDEALALPTRGASSRGRRRFRDMSLCLVQVLRDGRGDEVLAVDSAPPELESTQLMSRTLELIEPAGAIASALRMGWCSSSPLSGVPHVTLGDERVGLGGVEVVLVSVMPSGPRIAWR